MARTKVPSGTETKIHRAGQNLYKAVRDAMAFWEMMLAYTKPYGPHRFRFRIAIRIEELSSRGEIVGTFTIVHDEIKTISDK